jgi:hypothetical protein
MDSVVVVPAVRGRSTNRLSGTDAVPSVRVPVIVRGSQITDTDPCEIGDAKEIFANDGDPGAQEVLVLFRTFRLLLPVVINDSVPYVCSPKLLRPPVPLITIVEVPAFNLKPSELRPKTKASLLASVNEIVLDPKLSVAVVS